MGERGLVRPEETAMSKGNAESVGAKFRGSRQHVSTALVHYPRAILKYSHSFKVIEWAECALFSHILLSPKGMADGRESNQLLKEVYEAY